LRNVFVIDLKELRPLDIGLYILFILYSSSYATKFATM